MNFILLSWFKTQVSELPVINIGFIFLDTFFTNELVTFAFANSHQNFEEGCIGTTNVANCHIRTHLKSHCRFHGKSLCDIGYLDIECNFQIFPTWFSDILHSVEIETKAFLRATQTLNLYFLCPSYGKRCRQLKFWTFSITQRSNSAFCIGW